MNHFNQIENLYDLFKYIYSIKTKFLILFLSLFLLISLINYFQTKDVNNNEYKVGVVVTIENQNKKIFDFDLNNYDNQIQKFYNFEKFSNDKLYFTEIENIENILGINFDKKFFSNKNFTILNIINDQISLGVNDFLNKEYLVLKTKNLNQNDLFFESFIIKTNKSINKEDITRDLENFINTMHNYYIKEFIELKLEHIVKYKEKLMYNFQIFKNLKLREIRDYYFVLIRNEQALKNQMLNKELQSSEEIRNKIQLEIYDLENRILNYEKNFKEDIDEVNFCNIINQYTEIKLPVFSWDDLFANEYNSNTAACNDYVERIRLFEKLKIDLEDLQLNNFERDDFSIDVLEIKSQYNFFNLFTFFVVSLILSIILILFRSILKSNLSNRS